MSGAPMDDPNATAARSLVALGRTIRALRERLGITQEELAKKGGISVSFASLLERGERSPSYETLVQLASALEVSLPELFREQGSEKGDPPALARLLQFARRSQLTDDEVERLIAVAKAMFEPSGRAVASGAPQGVGGCSERGCTRPVLARGLCASHYHRARRARLT